MAGRAKSTACANSARTGDALHSADGGTAVDPDQRVAGAWLPIVQAGNGPDAVQSPNSKRPDMSALATTRVEVRAAGAWKSSRSCF